MGGPPSQAMLTWALLDIHCTLYDQRCMIRMSSCWGLTQGANLGPAPSLGPQIENALAENNALHPLLPSLRQSGALRQFFPQAQNCIARTGYIPLSSRKIKSKILSLAGFWDIKASKTRKIVKIYFLPLLLIPNNERELLLYQT